MIIKKNNMAKEATKPMSGTLNCATTALGNGNGAKIFTITVVSKSPINPSGSSLSFLKALAYSSGFISY
ncbi:hypothetical protein COY14_04850 [Candidatus Roizmanbacteria bacterium CG_4_10_14_0_2_um_filter_36_9]|uniref:Uncharacterized protein n=1 Tax=Candidatus Roizmanbacteria bacterium CG_4_10_14_0_2_um_filter_36_9 TaxID=1974823 RepID=A0A2M7U267_9BACT|nr:MAG: hypothetical protein COY14_04850 [Candidatus Roizmanbacteria bacterium CG_4_10_14_0_2_um_filter_36_9]